MQFEVDSVAKLLELKAQANASFRDGDYPLALQRTSEAIRLLEPGLVAAPDRHPDRHRSAGELSRLHSNLAAAHLELRSYASAAEEARKAIDLDPSWHRPYLRLSAALAGAGEPSEAIASVLQCGLCACGDPEQLQQLRDALSAMLGSRGGGATPRFTASETAADLPSSTAQQGTDSSAIEPMPAHKRQRTSCAQLSPSLSQRNSTAQETATVVDSAQERLHHDGQPPLRVTALCGFLGAGKTTLVRHLLSCLGSGAASRVGLLVNDLAPLNVDAQLLSAQPLLQPPPSLMPVPGTSPLTATLPPRAGAVTAAADGVAAALPMAAPEVAAAAAAVAAAAPAPPPPSATAAGELVELTNGCVCCNLAGELREALRRLADRSPPLEHAIVECTGVGEPAALAAAIAALEAEHQLRSHSEAAGSGSGSAGADSGDAQEDTAAVAQQTSRLAEAAPGAARRRIVLHQMVTVVDASSFLQVLGPARAAPDGGGGGDIRSSGLGPSASEPDGSQLSCGVAVGADRGGSVKARGGCAAAPAAPAAGGDSPAAPPARRPLAALLAQQVEGADVILLNKCDRLLGRVEQRRREGSQQPEQGRHQGGPCSVSDRQEGAPAPIPTASATAAVPTAVTAAVEGGESGPSTAATAAARRELAQVAALVRCLNPGVKVLPCLRCEVPLDAVLGSSGEGGEGSRAARRMAAAADSGGGAGGGVGADGPAGVCGGSVAVAAMGDVHVGAAAGDHGDGAGVGARAHEEDEYGIGSFVFRSRRPFHPGRMWALLQALAATGSEEAVGGVATGEMTAAERPAAADSGPGASADGVAAHQVEAHQAAADQAAAGQAETGRGGLPSLPHPPPPLLRAKGLFWIASLPQAIWELSLAGSEVEVAAVGRWLCTMVDREHWPVGRRPAVQPQRQGPEEPAAAAAAATEAQPPGHGAEAGAAAALQGRGSCPEGSCAGESGEEGQAQAGTAATGSCDPVDGMGGAGKSSRRWHPQWGDRENGLVFIGLGLSGLSQNGGNGQGVEVEAADEEGPEAAKGAGLGTDEGADACVGGDDVVAAGEALSPTARLAALLRWAQVTAAEEAEGEEAWEAWDDAPWLGMLERY